MIELEWSSDMAYAVGLMATDGHLSIDGRHLDLTSKDVEQLENFKKALDLNCKISQNFLVPKANYVLEFNSVM